jgi:isopentenyldiphosphate isomerase
MSEEIFDVVNERDEVTGQLPRREVHRLGLKHRAVHVLVFNRAGQIFLQKRSMRKDIWPGAWDSSASGHLDTGEDYDACAVRELREEIGLRVTDTAPASSIQEHPNTPHPASGHPLPSADEGRGESTISSSCSRHPLPSRSEGRGQGEGCLTRPSPAVTITSATARPRRLFKIEACVETGQEFCWIYRLEHEGPFELDPHEVERGEWFTPEQVTRWVGERPGEFASAFVLIWRLLRERGLV